MNTLVLTPHQERKRAEILRLSAECKPIDLAPIRERLAKEAKRKERRRERKSSGQNDHLKMSSDSTLSFDDLRTDHGRTELANAQRLIRDHGENVRYVPAWGKWLVWDGRRWKIDANDCGVQELGKASIVALWQDLARLGPELRESDAKLLLSFIKGSTSAGGVQRMLTLARSDPKVTIEHTALNRHPWRFNCENGTIDLTTGQLGPHRKADLITQISPTVFDAGADCQRWIQFVGEVFDGDKDLIRYVRQLAGYSLTGSTREHLLVFCHGRGANGKSTLFEVLMAVLGEDYAGKCPHDFLMAKQQGHPTDLTDLFGKRFAAAVEAGEGRSLNESLTKELSGGDKIRARRMREDFWEFEPSHKLWLAANHKPAIRGNDHGIWRRLRLLPFNVRFEGESDDKMLKDKLLAEASGILNWCLLGCQDWLANGLIEPEAVTAATAEYRSDEDVIGQFIREACWTGIDPSHVAPATALYLRYRRYCEDQRIRYCTQTAFGRELTDRGYEKFRGGDGKYYYRGIYPQGLD
jgi:putative DNA primase/helicase